MTELLVGKRLNELPFPSSPIGAEVYGERFGESVRIKVGDALGLTTLDADGKVPLEQIPDEVAAGAEALRTDLAAADAGKGADLVQYDADETVKERLDAIGNIRGDLAAGSGAALVGFQQPGSGSVARTLQAKLSDSISVLDYIPVAEHAAIKNGTTAYNCAPDFQEAFNDALSRGITEINVPAGLYLWATEVVVNGPVVLRSATLGDITTNTNGSGSGRSRPIIRWSQTASVNATMLTFVAPNVGEIIFGGGVEGIEWDGTGTAAYAVHLNNTKYAVFRGTARTFRQFAVRVSSRNGSTGNFSMENRIDISYVWGATTANPEAGSGGLLLEGNGSNVPSTQQVVERCDGLVYNGNLLQIDETDNAQIITTQCSVQSGGTGRGVYVRNVGAQGSNHTLFIYCVGKVKIDAGVIGTTFLHYNTETGGIDSSATNWHGDLVDYITGRRYRTPTYALRRSIEVPSGALAPNANAGTTDLAFQWPCRTLPEASSPALGAIIPKPVDMDAGVIESVDVLYGSNGTSAGNYRLTLTLSTVADDNSGAVVTPEVSTTQTVAAGSQYQLKHYTFPISPELAFAKGDTILARLARVPADAADTNTDAMAIVGLRINYRSTGPNSAGGGTYSVIPSF